MQGHPARRPFQHEAFGRPVAKRAGDTIGIEAECIESGKRGAGEFLPRKIGELRGVRRDDPWNLDEHEIVEIPRHRLRLALENESARVRRNGAEIGLGQRRVRAVEREQNRVRRPAHKLAPHRGQRLRRTVEAVDVGGRTALRQPFGRERRCKALHERRLGADDRHARTALGADPPRDKTRVALDRERKRVEVRNRWRAFIQLIERHREGQIQRDLRHGLEVVAQQRADDEFTSRARASSNAESTPSSPWAMTMQSRSPAALAAARNPARTASAALAKGFTSSGRISAIVVPGFAEGAAGAGLGGGGTAAITAGESAAGACSVLAASVAGGVGAGCAGAGAARWRLAPWPVRAPRASSWRTNRRPLRAPLRRPRKRRSGRDVLRRRERASGVKAHGGRGERHGYDGGRGRRCRVPRGSGFIICGGNTTG